MARQSLQETANLAFLYQGASMRGTFRPGDALVVLSVPPDKIRPGDVVAFRAVQPDGGTALVAHRVQGRVGAGFRTRGDWCPAPDAPLIAPNELLGRVAAVWRNGRSHPVWGGAAGRAWSALMHLYRFARRLLRRPYRLLRRSGLVRRLWRPRLSQVRLTTADGLLVKYLHGPRTVAWWWPTTRRFWCRKPYDLVIDRPKV